MEKMPWQLSDMQNPSSHSPDLTENSCHQSAAVFQLFPSQI